VPVCTKFYSPTGLTSCTVFSFEKHQDCVVAFEIQHKALCTQRKDAIWRTLSVSNVCQKDMAVLSSKSILHPETLPLKWAPFRSRRQRLAKLKNAARLNKSSSAAAVVPRPFILVHQESPSKRSFCYQFLEISSANTLKSIWLYFVLPDAIGKGH
jgi:hypothetical protein